jgi:hypothetical protein
MEHSHENLNPREFVTKYCNLQLNQSLLEYSKFLLSNISPKYLDVSLTESKYIIYLDYNISGMVGELSKKGKETFEEDSDEDDMTMMFKV